MIDIGANVGDTAALMARSPEIAILCIEGNEEFLPLLRANLASVSLISEVEPSYVGVDDANVSGRMLTYEGTAKLVEGDGVVRVKSLSQILESHPRFKNARLLKVDTDGFDAKIILAASDVIAASKPIAYIEYSPSESPAAEAECRAMIERLKSIGYAYFHVFDNFGNHMLRVPAEQSDHLHALNAYVRSSRKDLRPSLFYYDICAIAANDADISDDLLKNYVEDARCA